MCGFVGVVNGGSLQLSSQIVEKMSQEIAYRGPDSYAIWAEKDAIIAHRRLAIVDLSPAGRQPMHSHDGRYVLAYNGEIYNHLDLRAIVEKQRKIQWRGHSDSETLLEMLVTFGADKTLKSVNGMLAFALWDRMAQTLILARDRFGEKPLCYAELGRGIVYGSELKIFRHVPQISRTPDPAAVARYLNQWYVPAPLSILSGVKKLPPGHYMEWSADGKSRISQYWSPLETYTENKEKRFGSRVEAADEIEATLQSAVNIRKMSDVPLGALLSGGVDSSLVTALMQKSQSKPIKTFSIGFDDAAYDESKHSAAVAKHLGTEHEMLLLTEAEALNEVPKIASVYDEPFADASQLPTYLVSRLTRSHVTVALTGDGFDELFSGYARYVLTSEAWRQIKRLPLRGMMAKGISHLPDSAIRLIAKSLAPIIPRGVNPDSLAQKLKASGELLRANSAEDVYLSYMTAWPNPSQMMIDQTVPPIDRHISGLPQHIMHDAFMLRDQLDYLHNDILCKVDRASMAVSLETRVPALDPRVAALAWRIPPEERWHGGNGKSILREVLYRHVPKELIDRPKMGFSVPLDHWLRGPLKIWASDLLSPALLKKQGILNADAVSRRWVNFLSGGVTKSSQIWTILMFQAWMAEQMA